MLYKNKHTLKTASAKAGMCRKTGSKYVRSGKLPSACKDKRQYRTRTDPFAAHWDEIIKMLEQAPELQAKTIMTYLVQQYPEQYCPDQLRTLQRRLLLYRAEYGKNKEVIFLQNIQPGKMSQSDWTVMNSLHITIKGQPFDHMVFHFMLPYSNWESIMICHTESFDTLSQGYAQAVIELGGTLPEHRTDNLTAATKKAGNKRIFTERWLEFLTHYHVKPSRNNPGKSNENGSVEKSHDLFKNAVNQHLLLRGSRDFIDQASYEKFLLDIKDKRNQMRKEKLGEELAYLQALPERNWRDPIMVCVKVSPSSTIQILGCTYSVPSRLIAYSLQAEIFAETVDLYYGQQKLLTMPRIKEGIQINYMHIIDQLVRKPSAFVNYQYREQLFPQPIFRWAYDQLTASMPTKGHIHYLKLLQLAKRYGEHKVLSALQLCQKAYALPDAKLLHHQLQATEKLPIIAVNIPEPNLAVYDDLHNFGGVIC